MSNPVKTRNRFGRKVIAAVLRHHRHKPMLQYLEYLKSDSQPISEEERLGYRPQLKQWWLSKTWATKKAGPSAS